jgi:hypoxanthine-guanine phosphoribosyltransferase
MVRQDNSYLIVEDMIDTGGTLYFVEEFLSGNA